MGSTEHTSLGISSAFYLLCLDRRSSLISAELLPSWPWLSPLSVSIFSPCFAGSFWAWTLVLEGQVQKINLLISFVTQSSLRFVTLSIFYLVFLSRMMVTVNVSQVGIAGLIGTLTCFLTLLFKDFPVSQLVRGRACASVCGPLGLAGEQSWYGTVGLGPVGTHGRRESNQSYVAFLSKQFSPLKESQYQVGLIYGSQNTQGPPVLP